MWSYLDEDLDLHWCQMSAVWAYGSLMSSWLHPALPWSPIPATFVPGILFIWQLLYGHCTQPQKALQMCIKQIMCQGVWGAEMAHFYEMITKK